MTIRALTQCTLKRLLHNTQTWPSATLICSHRQPPAPTIPYRRAHSTVFAAASPRQVDIIAKETTVARLLFVLRRFSGRKHGFGNRDDNWVSLKKLLNHPEFCNLDVSTLQTMIDRDIKHRLVLHYDPTKVGDNWWIRARLWNERHWVLKPVFAKDNVGTAVYPTTLHDWKNYISRHGIGLHRQEEEYIQVSRGIPTNEYLHSLEEEEQVFVFVNIRACIDSGIRFVLPVPSAQDWSATMPLLTKGDETGHIPTSFFTRVERLTARKSLIWGDQKPLFHRGWVSDDYLLDENGARRTTLMDRHLHGFAYTVGMYGSGPSQPRLDPELAAEAMEALQP